jgi:iron complex outermembrane receptor protein
VPNLTLRGGVSILDAYYTDFSNAVGTGIGPGTGVNAGRTINISNQVQDLSGKELVRAPNYSGNVGIDYELPTDIGKFLLTSTLSFTDSFVVSNPSVYGPQAPAALQNKQRLRQKAYQTLSAQLSWTDPSDHLTLAIYGNNLTNEKYRISYNAGTNGDYSARAEPITYGMRLGYKF